jgi:hypothetical protein
MADDLFAVGPVANIENIVSGYALHSKGCLRTASLCLGRRRAGCEKRTEE